MPKAWLRHTIYLIFLILAAEFLVHNQDKPLAKAWLRHNPFNPESDVPSGNRYAIQLRFTYFQNRYIIQVTIVYSKLIVLILEVL
jgi:hypothetical protein